MKARLSIFGKIFLAISALALLPLVITTALISSNYQSVLDSLEKQIEINLPPEVVGHFSQIMGETAQDVYVLTAVVLLFSAILVLFVALYLSRSFTQPLRALLDATGFVAQGDFQVRLASARQDEFSDLADGFNRMAEQLAETRRRLNETNEELERRIAERTAELRMSNLQLRLAAQNIEEQVRIRGEFLANLSHELLTPLHAVLGYTELLLESAYGSLNEAQVRTIRKIRRGARSLQRLTNDLIDAARTQMSRESMVIEFFDPAALIADTVDNLATFFAGKGVELRREIAADLPRVQTDRDKLRHILYNLLSNALKFTPAGVVVVRAALRDGEATFCLEVEDTGPGIAADRLSAIFDSFRQLDGSTTRSAGGTGLGLALTRQWVDLLGGRIEVDSEPGRGSTFRVLLPVRQPAAGASSESDARGPVVLAIDDDDEILDLLVASLEPAGFQVVRCRDGEQGVDLARRLRPHAVTLDLRLPDRDGWSVLNELKSDPDTADIPVIVLSVLDERARGERSGADAYFLKPFDREQLIGRLNAIRRHATNLH